MNKAPTKNPPHMRTYVLADRTVIHVVQTSSGRSPKCTEGGCATSHGKVWFRVNGGNWTPTMHRVMHRIEEWIRLCDTYDDFYEGEQDHDW